MTLRSTITTKTNDCNASNVMTDCEYSYFLLMADVLAQNLGSTVNVDAASWAWVASMYTLGSQGLQRGAPERVLPRVEEGQGSREQGDGAEAEFCDFRSHSCGGQKKLISVCFTTTRKSIIQVKKSIVQVAHLSCTK